MNYHELRYVVEFFDAEGLSHKQPSLGLITRAVNTGSEENWSLGSGQAAIYWQKGDLQKDLVLTPSGDDSYFLELSSSALPDWSYMSTTDSDSKQDTQVYVGGDPWLIPSKLFVSKLKALEAVNEFYLSGEPSRMLSWIHSDEVKFTENF